MRGKQAVLPWGKHDEESGTFHRLEGEPSPPRFNGFPRVGGG